MVTAWPPRTEPTAARTISTTAPARMSVSNRVTITYAAVAAREGRCGSMTSPYRSSMLSKNDTIDCRFVKWVALYVGTVAAVDRALSG